MSDKRGKDLSKAPRADVERFLRQVAATPRVTSAGQRGRLIFAMDATASRAPLWDQACHIQAEMFRETAQLGGLSIQLVHFGGYQEFHASPWYDDAGALLKQMTAVTCLSGMTQIERVLRHALAETRARRVQALVFVGDACEEDPAVLHQLAGQLNIAGTPAFVFQEGADALAEAVFREIARLSGGAWCRFDAGSAQQLRDLLAVVAVYAAGGRKALEQHSAGKRGLARELVRQLPAPK